MISDPLVGQVLDERYRVDSRIARGGMATVYRAQDTRLDRTVALKAMHPSLAEDDSFVARFIGEAKSAARLSHPNVVSVYDQGSDAGVVFLTMEYLPGRTVRDLLTEQGRLEPDEALRIMEAVLAALGAAHHAGFVHRDVKPENVLLAPDDRIKVADFGLARAIAASNHTKTSGLLIGTVAYLSPEQVARGVADARSDVYSAGILLYELLTGRQPFSAETPLAVAYKHVNQDVPTPSSAVPELPYELDALVTSATQRTADNRPADAASLLATTSAVRARLHAGADSGDAGVGTLTVPHSRGETLVVSHDDLEPTSRNAQAVDGGSTGGAEIRRGATSRRRGVIALVAVLVLALVAGGVGYYYGWGRWTQTPALTGMTVDKATKKAEQLGFRVDSAEPEFSKTVADGHVIATQPEAQGRILEGGTITLIPSKGKPVVPVPDVAGQSLRAAKRALRSQDLKVGDVAWSYSSSVPPGDVVATKPAAGKTLTIGSTVDISRSAGVEVPSVVGEPIDDATESLEGSGFVAEVVAERYNADVPEGAVIAQVPSSGGAAEGSTIELTVSKGPRPVPVPDVLGQDADDAVATLEDAGFQVDVNDLPFPGNEIRAQRPAAGTELRPGSTVTIFAW